MQQKNIFISYIFALLLCVATGQLGAQQTGLSIEQLHDISSTMVNYQPDSALQLLDEAALKIAVLKNQTLAEEYWAENNLRRAEYWLFEDPEKASKLVQKAQDYYVKHPDNNMLAYVYCTQGQLLKSRGAMQTEALQNSLSLINKALSYAIDQSNPSTTAYVYYELAITLQQLKRWHESLDNAYQALQYAKQSNDSLSISMSFFLMGRIYQHFGFWDYAETNIEQAIEYGKGLDLRASMIYGYARILENNNKPELALQNYHLALNPFLKNGLLPYALKAYTAIGQLHFSLHNYTEAQAAYKSILSLTDSIKATFPETKIFIAQMQHYLGQNKQMLNTLEQFKTQFTKNEVEVSGAKTYKAIADLYATLNQTHEAATYYKLWGQLTDSIQQYTNRVQLGEIEELYVNEQAKNEEINQKNEALNKSRTLQATFGIALLALILIGGGALYFIRLKGLKENQKLKDALKTKQLKQLIEGQETERQKIGRDLHDGIGQSLAALKMQLQFYDTDNKLHESVEKVDALCNEVRTLSHSMMPVVLNDAGLEKAVQKLLNNSLSPAKIEQDFVTLGMDQPIPELIEINLYRILQELIANIIKHAQAKKVGVQLLAVKQNYILIVEDNGQGFDPAQGSSGIGLSNIQSRVEGLGGVLKIQSSATEGTFVHISIPKSQNESKKSA